MSPLRPLYEVIRFAPARPAVYAGLRAGAAAVLPLVAGGLLAPQLISWLSLGGFLTALVDKGGAYRTRASVMASVALFGSLACFLGTAVGGELAWAVPLAFLWLVGCGLAQVGGAGAAGAGTVVAVIFVVALARPAADVEAALVQGAALLGGSLWAMALALLLWPVRLYRPARMAIARVFERLGDLAAELADRDGDGEAIARRLVAGRAAVRTALEEAREVLTATRRGRQAESERGERLVAAVENADQLLGVVIALDGWLESAPASGSGRTPVVEALQQLERSARTIAGLLRRDRGDEVRVPRLDPGAAALVNPLLARLGRHLTGAAEAVEGLASGRPLRGQVPRLASPVLRRGRRELLGEVLDYRSAILRHALRLGIAGAVAAGAVSLLRIEYGYWVTVTVIVILQPWTSATLFRALQRIGGTVLGALIAVAAVAVVDERLAFAAIVFLLCSASVMLLPLNYGVFSVLLTPAFVLLAELGTGDYRLAWVRIVDTLIGGGIALVAALTLWPRWERQRFPEELALALRSSAAWFRALGQDRPGSHEAEAARRQVGIAVLNAEASLQRLLSEAWIRGAMLEPALALVLYLRRLHGTAMAFFSDPELDAALRSLVARETAAFLEEMAGCIAAGRAPAPLDEPPHLETLLQGGGASPALERLVRQLAIVHGTAERAFAGGAFVASFGAYQAGDSAAGGAR